MVERVFTTYTVKCQALLESLRFAKVEGLTIWNWCPNDYYCSSKWPLAPEGLILGEIRKIIVNDFNVSVSYIPRKCNNVAHVLAKLPTAREFLLFGGAWRQVYYGM